MYPSRNLKFQTFSFQPLNYERSCQILTTCNRGYKSKYEKVGVLPIQIAKSNILSVALRQRETLFLSDEGPTLETLDSTIRIGSTPTFSYFDAAHYA